MQDLFVLVGLKLGSKEKVIVEVLYELTKSWITESNEVGKAFAVTASELIEKLEDTGKEISWSVQLLLDLELIQKTENKIELTRSGRLYGAILSKDLLIES
jgi:hypothetical protein